jgi:hypothetical protein
MAAARHAAETLFREQRPVDNGHQPRFVNVFSVAGRLESGIACIDVKSHDKR